MANSLDSDHTALEELSDLGLHFLLRGSCPNISFYSNANCKTQIVSEAVPVLYCELEAKISEYKSSIFIYPNHFSNLIETSLFDYQLAGLGGSVGLHLTGDQEVASLTPAVANSLDSDHTALEELSDLGLHFLLRGSCPNTSSFTVMPTAKHRLLVRQYLFCTVS